MAKTGKTWLAKPKRPEHLECEKANGSQSAKPIRDSGSGRSKSPNVRLQSDPVSPHELKLGKVGASMYGRSVVRLRPVPPFGSADSRPRPCANRLPILGTRREIRLETWLDDLGPQCIAFGEGCMPSVMNRSLGGGVPAANIAVATSIYARRGSPAQISAISAFPRCS